MSINGSGSNKGNYLISLFIGKATQSTVPLLLSKIIATCVINEFLETESAAKIPRVVSFRAALGKS